MDPLAHTLANVLVDNPGDCATLEITLQGPLLRFRAGALIALAGADLGARLDDLPLPPGRAVRVLPGTLLSFGKRLSGARTYLAVHGGYRLPSVLGSISTNRRTGLGGVAGRPLLAGDLLPINSSFRNPPRLSVPEGLWPFDSEAPIRIIPGREWAAFDAQAQRDLVEQRYRITNDSERMGYRLAGPSLQLKAPLELLSEAVTFGTLQVPPDGQPIILMADRQTTGGYPKIAHVASIDLPRLAQMLPGEELSFCVIDLDTAQQLAMQRARWVQALETAHC
jgi:biotin-dependent carboxylase-like uncharacterized protein